MRSTSRSADKVIWLEAGFCLGVNTVFDRDALSVPKCSMPEGPLTLATAAGAILASADLCAGTENDAPSRAAMNTVENGALHMNFPLLEQAQVCWPRLQPAIVRMAHELFPGYKPTVWGNIKLHLCSFIVEFLQRKPPKNPGYGKRRLDAGTALNVQTPVQSSVTCRCSSARRRPRA